MSQLIITSEVAKMLNASESLIYAYAKKGILKSVVLPHSQDSKATKQNRNAIRFRLEDVEEFIHSHLRQSHPNEKVMR
jgi:predicted DNA-binding transcriptional regulator AlpA